MEYLTTAMQLILRFSWLSPQTVKVPLTVNALSMLLGECVKTAVEKLQRLAAYLDSRAQKSKDLACKLGILMGSNYLINKIRNFDTVMVS